MATFLIILYKSEPDNELILEQSRLKNLEPVHHLPFNPQHWACLPKQRVFKGQYTLAGVYARYNLRCSWSCTPAAMV